MSACSWPEPSSAWFPAQLSAGEPALRLQGASAGCRNQRRLHSTIQSSTPEFKLCVTGLDQSVNSNLLRYGFFHTLLVKSQAPNVEALSLHRAVCINHLPAWRRLRGDLSAVCSYRLGRQGRQGQTLLKSTRWLRLKTTNLLQRRGKTSGKVWGFVF